MNALVCQVSWNTFYRGEASSQPCSYILNDKDCTNFVNLNGYYFGYFNASDLKLKNNVDKMRVDYLIFVSNDIIVGWYKNATILVEESQHKMGNFYHAICKDEDGVLLPEKERNFSLPINGSYEWKQMDRRLKVYLEKNKQRVNYRQSDINKTINLKLNDIKYACEMIEKMIASQNYLNALQLTNTALNQFGNLASLIYYKATLMYFLLQYQSALHLLNQVMHVEAYQDLVNYMIGNILFETEDYEKSIQYLNKVKRHNLDLTHYMLAQAYAMKGQVAFAKGAIEKAIIENPNEKAYQDFKEQLRKWNHE